MDISLTPLIVGIVLVVGGLSLHYFAQFMQERAHNKAVKGA
jgi:hypothetical protein